jgi:hypothetical protein
MAPKTGAIFVLGVLLALQKRTPMPSPEWWTGASEISLQKRGDYLSPRPGKR